MKSVISLMVGAFMFALAGVATAEEGGNPHHGMGPGHGKGPGQGIEKRLQNQKRRIQKGLEKGKLTPEQAAELNSKVDQIKAEKDAAMADGKISKEEGSKLKEELKDSSKQIWKEKHPNQPAPAATVAPVASPAN